MDDIEAELNIPAADDDDDEDEDLSSDDEPAYEERIKKPIHLHSAQAHRSSLRETGFHQSTRECLKMIRNAMLHHEWQEAVEYFTSYIQTLEDKTASRRPLAREIVWRIGTELLHHLPNSKAEDFNAVYEQTKNAGVSNYAKISLEHAFHLLLNGQFEEAKRQLSVAGSWRYGKHSTAQSLEIKLIRAYSGFLDYFTWCEKRSTVSRTDDSSSNREMHTYFRQASVTLQEIVRQPGVWDPFVLSYIAMLEFYNEEEEALKVLQNYAYNQDFPSNPNAHVYLYQYLKRHKAPKSELISSLRILHSLVPSHRLMLKLCSLLLQTDQQKDVEEALRICMDLLEFSSWKSDKKAWNCLLTIMRVLKQKYLKKIIYMEWSTRRGLWLPLHFRPYIGRKESVEDVKLLTIKRKVLLMTGENNREYLRIALKFGKESTSEAEEDD